MRHKPYSVPRLALRYIAYYFRAGNGKGHGIHSPFVYAFIREVLIDRRRYYAYERVENLRASLLRDKSELEVTDLGAGSGKNSATTRRVASITRHAAKPAKLGRLLFRVVNYFQPAVMVELGTSMGITAAYLASANQAAQLYTIEGSPAIAARAVQNLATLQLTNATVIQGNFDDILAELLRKIPTPDLVYIDGNHRYEATLRYFNEILPSVQGHTILVFDDIHWSEEMEAAWNAIKLHPSVKCSIDIFFLGFIFFRPEFKVPQHFEIRF